MSSLAMSPAPVDPDPWASVRELWPLLISTGALAAIGKAGWKTLVSWRRRREKRSELLDALAEAVSLSLDLERFRFEYAPGRIAFEDYLDGPARDRWDARGGVGQSPREQWEALKVRTRNSRSRTWLAQGFPEAPHDSDPDEREQHAEQVRVLREMKTTKRWRTTE